MIVEHRPSVFLLFAVLIGALSLSVRAQDGMVASSIPSGTPLDVTVTSSDEVVVLVHDPDHQLVVSPGAYSGSGDVYAVWYAETLGAPLRIARLDVSGTDARLDADGTDVVVAAAGTAVSSTQTYGSGDGMVVAKIRGDATAVLWTTGIGSDGADAITELAVSTTGTVAVVGAVSGTGFPITKGAVTTDNTRQIAFVLSGSGGTLQASRELYHPPPSFASGGSLPGQAREGRVNSVTARGSGGFLIAGDARGNRVGATGDGVDDGNYHEKSLNAYVIEANASLDFDAIHVLGVADYGAADSWYQTQSSPPAFITFGVAAFGGGGNAAGLDGSDVLFIPGEYIGQCALPYPMGPPWCDAYETVPGYSPNEIRGQAYRLSGTEAIERALIESEASVLFRVLAAETSQGVVVPFQASGSSGDPIELVRVDGSGSPSGATTFDGNGTEDLTGLDGLGSDVVLVGTTTSTDLDGLAEPGGFVARAGIAGVVDLAVDAFGVTYDPNAPENHFSLALTIENLGSAASSPSRADLYVSSSATERGDDLQAHTVIPSIPPSTSITFYVHVPQLGAEYACPPPGPPPPSCNYAWIVIDADGQAGQPENARLNDEASVQIVPPPVGGPVISPTGNTGAITGRITSAGAAVQGATVQWSGVSQSGEATTDLEGRYALLDVPAGTNYTLTVSAPGYATRERPGVVVARQGITVGVDVELYSSGPVALRTLALDPNPDVSQIEEGGVAHRYLQVVDASTGTNPIAGVPVEVRAGVGPIRTFVSGPDGLVDLAFPSSWIGGVGASKIYIVETVNGQPVPPGDVSVHRVSVIKRRGVRTWRNRIALDLAVGASAAVYAALTGELGQEGETQLDFNSSGPFALSLTRGTNFRGGIEVGVKPPLGIVPTVEAEANASVGCLTRDRYQFPYNPTPTDAQARAQFLVLARQWYPKLPPALGRLLTHLESISDGQNLVDAYQYDAFDCSVKGGASGSLGLDFGGNLEVGLSAEASIGVEAEAGTGIKNLADGRLRRSAFLAGRYSASAGYGLNFFGGKQGSAARSAVAFDPVRRLALSLADDLANLGADAEVRARLTADALWEGDQPRSLTLTTKQGGKFTVNAPFDLSLSEPAAIERTAEFPITPELLNYVRTSAQGSLAHIALDPDASRLSMVATSLTASETLSSLYERVAFLQRDGVYPAVTYEITGRQSSLDFGLSPEVSSNVTAYVGLGGDVAFENHREAVGERGVWYGGRFFPLETYDEMPAMEEVGLATVWGGVVSSAWDVYAQDAMDLNSHAVNTVGSTVIELAQWSAEQTGAAVEFTQGAIETGVEQVHSAVSGWWGRSPQSRPTDLSARARAAAMAYREASQSAARLEYGIGGFYELSPGGLSLQAPATITIRYDENELAGIEESELRLYRLATNTGAWTLVGGSVDVEANEVSAPITALGLYTLAPRMPGGAVALAAARDSVEVGSGPVEVVATGLVNNDGSPVPDGTLFTVASTLGEVVATDADPVSDGIQVGVAGGAFAFEVQPGPLAGEAVVTVTSQSGTASGTTVILVSDTSPPTLSPTGLFVSASDGRVSALWNPVPGNDIVGYEVLFDTDDASSPLDGVADGGLMSPVFVPADTSTVLFGFANDRPVYVAVRAVDGGGNVGPSTAVLSATPEDGEAPGAVADLHAVRAAGEARIRWVASGDNGLEGRAALYQLRTSATPPSADTLSWWEGATPVTVDVFPAPAGTLQSIGIPSSSGDLYVGIRVMDETGSVSAIRVVQPVDGITLRPRIMLGGAYDGVEATAMGATLGSTGAFPTDQPFRFELFSDTPLDYDGIEAIGPSTPASDVVDWVLVELRANATSVALARRAALVRADGIVVDLDGTSPVAFPGVVAGRYFVVIRHRTHLPVMTPIPVDLESGYATYDFTTSLSKAYSQGGAPMISMGMDGAPPFALWPGDGDLDGRVLASDYQDVWRALSGQEGYLQGDFDLDGRVLASDYQDVWRPRSGLAESQVPEAESAASVSTTPTRVREVRIGTSSGSQ